MAPMSAPITVISNSVPVMSISGMTCLRAATGGQTGTTRPEPKWWLVP